MPSSHQQQAAVSLERSLDAFLGDIQDNSPEHAAMTQSVVNAVKVFSASIVTTGSLNNPQQNYNTSSPTIPTTVVSDRESALASLLNAVVMSSSSSSSGIGVGSGDGTDLVENSSSADLTAQLKLFREDVDVIEAYKCRIIELQKVINGTKLPGELSAMVEPAVRNGRGQVVAVNADGSASQQQNETIHKLTKHIVTLKEKLDRAEAENCQWSANVAALLGENSMLTDRVKLLEAEVNSLGKNNASLTKEVTKARLQNTTTTGGGNGGGGDIIIGGMVIDAEVALWIKDVYVGLSQGKETNEVLAAISQNNMNVETLRSLPPQRAVSSRTRPLSSSTADSTTVSSSSASPANNTTPFAEAMRAKNAGKSQ